MKGLLHLISFHLLCLIIYLLYLSVRTLGVIGPNFAGRIARYGPLNLKFVPSPRARINLKNILRTILLTSFSRSVL